MKDLIYELHIFVKKTPEILLNTVAKFFPAWVLRTLILLHRQHVLLCSKKLSIWGDNDNMKLIANRNMIMEELPRTLITIHDMRKCKAQTQNFIKLYGCLDDYFGTNHITYLGKHQRRI